MINKYLFQIEIQCHDYESIRIVQSPLYIYMKPPWSNGGFSPQEVALWRHVTRFNQTVTDTAGIQSNVALSLNCLETNRVWNYVNITDSGWIYCFVNDVIT